MADNKITVTVEMDTSKVRASIRKAIEDAVIAGDSAEQAADRLVNRMGWSGELAAGARQIVLNAYQNYHREINGL